MSEKKYSGYLQNLKGISAGVTDTLKIRYRPYICPFDFIIKTASESESVFDIGCGNGQLIFLIDAFSGKKKYLKGIEISDKLVEQAIRIYKENPFHINIKFEKYDGKTLPDDMKEYDLVTMIDVLHHIPADLQEDILRQVFSKMKSGARFLLKDIDADSLLVFFNKAHDLILSGEIGKERSANRVKSILEKTGFRIINCFKQRTLWYPHYFILCEKT
jgi:SAM-dependent methyltransferase